jgi:beta-glucosidase
VLPLKKQGKVALIGPLADCKYNVGTWSVTATYQSGTLREAMQRALQGKAEVLYAQGSNFCRDADIEENGAFYRVVPRGDEGQMKQEALRIAQEADVIVCAMGEEQEMTGESASRSDLEMPDVQRELLAELVRLGKPLVLLNYAGRPTVLTWESEHVPAILNVWFGGSEGSDAICDVLFGDKVPSGRLTVSMPMATGQEPLYYNHLPTGRPVAEGAKKFEKFKSNYLDVSNDPLYPFGYGLSYTTFDYGELTLSSSEMATDGSITATIRVTNTGKRDGDEVVQLYIHDVAASISRPVKELKGFERIHLKAGESREVTFRITPDLLGFYNYNLEYVVEPGAFEVMAGPDSSLERLRKATLTVR